MRLVTLPMGWTNLIPIFHDDVTEILKAEILEYTILYIDDVPVKEPVGHYETAPRIYETIVENGGICHFVWKHMQDVNQILQRMKYPVEDRIGVIMHWEKCNT